MTFIRITKIFRFEMAHLLQHHDGLCRNIHGHSYRLEVCAGGTPLEKTGDSKNGMVWDFGDMKRLVTKELLDIFDHALVINKNGQEGLIKNLQEMNFKIVSVPFEPTSENLVSFFADVISQKIPSDIQLISLKLHETETAFAEWFSEENRKEPE